MSWKEIKEQFEDTQGLAIGNAIEKEKILDIRVKLPLKTLTLHGLIGGSTGTGKSRAIQVIVEQLAGWDVPVLLGDLKGDISGFAFPNKSEKAAERAKKMKMQFEPKSFETNYWSISDRFIPFRLKLDNIDPILIARILKLNETQESNLRMAYLYAKTNSIALIDLIDLKNILAFISRTPDAAEGATSSSIDVILRQVKIAIGEGLNELFGEPEIELHDILFGINIINLSNWRRRSDILAILMSFIIYKLFNEMPDIGDVNQPKLVVFIDEAHYLFQDANSSLVNLFITVLKQIRSKGIGVFFSTQNPEDIPEKILEQLGCKIEFALRAFTKKELLNIHSIAKAFPPTTHYDLEKEITALGNGIAIVSALDDSGMPIFPIKTMIAPPQSFTEVVSDEQIRSKINKNMLSKYKNSPEPRRSKFIGGELIQKLPIRHRPYINESIQQNATISRKVAWRLNKSRDRLKLASILTLFILLLLIIIILILRK